MLLQFTVENFKSFRERSTLSMEATEDDYLEDANVAVDADSGVRLVKTAAIYGANASGKSNYLEAITVFRKMILESSRDSQIGQRLPVTPFALHAKSETAPSTFEAVFLKDGIRYRYGFACTQQSIAAEWLYRRGKSIRESCLFEREQQKIQVAKTFPEGRGLEERTRENALFLSVVAQFNGKTSGDLVRQADGCRVAQGGMPDQYMGFTANLLGDSNYRNRLLELVRSADVGIEDMVREEVGREKLEQTLPLNMPAAIRDLVLQNKNTMVKVKTLHQHYNAAGEPDRKTEFDIAEEESKGTLQFVALTGPILHTLQEGAVLMIDEFDSSLHPLLTKHLLGLFQSPANQRNAQLIFATHDEGLLDSRKIRRDQVWFAEKGEFGGSTLYCLDEIRGVRKQDNFEKEYLLGQFGGIPRIRNFPSGMTHEQS